MRLGRGSLPTGANNYLMRYTGKRLSGWIRCRHCRSNIALGWRSKAGRSGFRGLRASLFRATARCDIWWNWLTARRWRQSGCRRETAARAATEAKRAMKRSTWSGTSPRTGLRLRSGQAPPRHHTGWRRATICVSSQVGCAVNCKFCFTALLGVKRNLEAGEIVGQIAAVLRDQGVEPPLQRVNIVFMGMGEPFLNYDNFMKSVRLLAEGVGIPESRMTVSTAGIVPRIHDFGQEPLRPKLAISLNGSNDALRSEVMPLNRKWNLAELMKAAREFPLRARERLTFEYVLLADVNDAPEQAREVVELVRGIRAKINLIALNPGTELPYRTPEQERVLAFQRILVAAGIPTFVRRPRGRDIFAACGQLKRTVELAPGSPVETRHGRS